MTDPPLTYILTCTQLKHPEGKPVSPLNTLCKFAGKGK